MYFRMFVPLLALFILVASNGYYGIGGKLDFERKALPHGLRQGVEQLSGLARDQALAATGLGTPLIVFRMRETI